MFRSTTKIGKILLSYRMHNVFTYKKMRALYYFVRYWIRAKKFCFAFILKKSGERQRQRYLIHKKEPL